MISDSDFNQIYEEDDEDENHSEDSFHFPVPDPVIVRGAGNVTM